MLSAPLTNIAIVINSKRRACSVSAGTSCAHACCNAENLAEKDEEKRVGGSAMGRGEKRVGGSAMGRGGKRVGGPAMGRGRYGSAGQRWGEALNRFGRVGDGA